MPCPLEIPFKKTTLSCDRCLITYSCHDLSHRWHKRHKSAVGLIVARHGRQTVGSLPPQQARTKRVAAGADRSVSWCCGEQLSTASLEPAGKGSQRRGVGDAHAPLSGCQRLTGGAGDRKHDNLQSLDWSSWRQKA